MAIWDCHVERTRSGAAVGQRWCRPNPAKRGASLVIVDTCEESVPDFQSVRAWWVGVHLDVVARRQLHSLGSLAVRHRTVCEARAGLAAPRAPLTRRRLKVLALVGPGVPAPAP